MSTISKARGGLLPLDWVSSLSMFPLLAPAIRIEEFLEGETYTLRAELPGTDPAKDVTVTCADGELRLHVVRSGERTDRTRSEFHYGSFYRTVPLPAGAREETITAEYADGILTVKVLVGTPESAGRSIPIAVGTDGS
ncbi:Hsp20/alpha crystallin family protein [Micromonospora sp. WMMD1102]|uniref:Hsp20/alpha crystallin family protein n=1 Tax=Micromonospora sp. WMMD1102 TaxID=3016105 RepID=UPI0024156F88|nr:Hsp20/alpha crystallin family protein [Micromonospora sp. WMMD1102]MDG4786696.1 Hsp20/alpha crystallin family protein [Micromonospora sp. WMMD1102]